MRRYRAVHGFMGRALLVVLLVWAAVAGYERLTRTKLAELSQRLQQLREEQQKRQAELVQLDKERLALRLEIQEARAAAERSRCEALVSQMDAEVIVTRVECVKAQAEYSECNAENSARTADHGFWGCVLGLGAAVVTGGAAAPLTLAGCGGGLVVATASEETCGSPPQCTQQFNDIRATVLAKRRLARMPICSRPSPPTLR